MEKKANPLRKPLANKTPLLYAHCRSTCQVIPTPHEHAPTKVQPKALAKAETLHPVQTNLTHTYCFAYRRKIDKANAKAKHTLQPQHCRPLTATATAFVVAFLLSTLRVSAAADRFPHRPHFKSKM